MFKLFSPEEEKSLADHLKREARANRPEFSLSLHRQIIDAVDCPEAAARRPETGRHTWRWARAAALLFAVLGGSFLWRSLPRDAERNPQQVRSDPAAENHQTALDQQEKSFDPPWAAEQWAYLNHDAQTTVGWLLDSLPLSLASSEEEAPTPQ